MCQSVYLLSPDTNQSDPHTTYICPRSWGWHLSPTNNHTSKLRRIGGLWLYPVWWNKIFLQFTSSQTPVSLKNSNEITYWIEGSRSMHKDILQDNSFKALYQVLGFWEQITLALDTLIFASLLKNTSIIKPSSNNEDIFVISLIFFTFLRVCIPTFPFPTSQTSSEMFWKGLKPCRHRGAL